MQEELKNLFQALESGQAKVQILNSPCIINIQALACPSLQSATIITAIAADAVTVITRPLTNPCAILCVSAHRVMPVVFPCPWLSI